MAEVTKIEWAMSTWNPWLGCSRVHTGCEHCYAEAMAGRFGVTWGPHGTRRKTSDAYWRKPLKWEREAAMEAGTRPRIFPSLCDPFEDWAGQVIDSSGLPIWCDPAGTIPHQLQVMPGRSDGIMVKAGLKRTTLADLRRDFFGLIDETPHLAWLLLTKRPENIRRMWPVWDEDAPDGLPGQPATLENVWLIYSASDQATLEAGLPHLLACRDLVPVLGLSLEPLVGPVDLSGVKVDWVIVGGESGPHARPCNIDWICSVVEQCAGAGVPCFVKQLGAIPVMYYYGEEGLRERCLESDGRVFEPARDGWTEWKWKHNRYQPRPGTVLEMPLRDPKGGDPTEWPEDLQVRQFPAGGLQT